MRRDRLLDEHRNTREVLQDLQLDIATRFGASAEHGRRANYKCIRPFGLRLAPDIFVEIFVDPSVLVRRDDEGVALRLEHLLGALDGWVDERNDLEARAELAGGGEDTCRESRDEREQK